MSKSVNLLEGSITKSLAKLAFPIMGTSLIQMAYNLVDMIWIGRVSSNAVAAVGAAGMYFWLANGIIGIARIGGQVKLAQSLGAGNKEDARRYTAAAVQTGLLFSVVCTILLICFHKGLIQFFKLNHESVVKDAEIYLIIVGAGLLFNFMNQVFTGLMTARGKSTITFCATTTGLALNFILDPVMIFGMGPFPRMEVAGAALATVLAQMLVFFMFFRELHKEKELFGRKNLFRKIPFLYFERSVQIGIPIAVQNTLFSAISMIIARLIAEYGDAAIAVQKVGSQIESISWMTAEGFASAVNAFVAQNHGAGKRQRVQRGYTTAMRLMILWGIITTIALIVFPEFFFRIFITEEEVIPMGVDYLRILGVSQIFMCMEITSSGAFQGLSHPIPPAVTGIIFNSARIPMAMVLSASVLGLNGIWWSISISSIIKGIIVPVWFWVLLRNYLKQRNL